MIVTIDGIEYTVPEPVGKMVNEAKEYKRLLGGKTPGELDQWLDKVTEWQELILSNQAEFTETLHRMKEAINKKAV